MRDEASALSSLGNFTIEKVEVKKEIKVGTSSSGKRNKAECDWGKHLGVPCTKQYKRAAQKSRSLLQS